MWDRMVCLKLKKPDKVFVLRIKQQTREEVRTSDAPQNW